jgi:outer membrane protein OmpA-like peptidoglycan-associated protein
LVEKGLAVTLDGFGDDPCTMEESIRLCATRLAAAATRLQAAGVPASRVNTAFVLGNYHYLAPREDAAGRAFNRRIELRPCY